VIFFLEAHRTLRDAGGTLVALREPIKLHESKYTAKPCAKEISRRETPTMAGFDVQMSE
jgi:hypothetical protein